MGPGQISGKLRSTVKSSDLRGRKEGECTTMNVTFVLLTSFRGGRRADIGCELGLVVWCVVIGNEPRPYRRRTNP